MTPGIVWAKNPHHVGGRQHRAYDRRRGVMGEIATLPATNAREAMPEPYFTTTTSAS